MQIITVYLRNAYGMVRGYIFLSEGSATSFTTQMVNKGMLQVAKQTEIQASPFYFPPRSNLLLVFNPEHDQEAIPLPPVLNMSDGQPAVAYTTKDHFQAASLQIRKINAATRRFFRDVTAANYGGTDLHA